ncbi:unnamed protein product [Porites lobata]|uniref:Uncharacterized protein n=1 Tax=Porites lobata TaxID=104759 RepID=A0ABN8QRJ4_9CNID|nr:unnamed protein product [Porites lobata]
MPSANTFADIFKTALAPVLSQLSSLNNNVTTVLQSGHEESDEDGETASVDEPANSGDMDADVSALLAAAGTDQNNEAMPARRPPHPFAKGWRPSSTISYQKRWGRRN